MWSFPVASPDVRGLLVCVSVVLVTKLLLGKNTLNPPSSFSRERPSKGVFKTDLDEILNSIEIKPAWCHGIYYLQEGLYNGLPTKPLCSYLLNGTNSMTCNIEFVERFPKFNVTCHKLCDQSLPWK